MNSVRSSNNIFLPILQAVHQTDGQAGPGDLAKILLGRKSKRLARLDFDHLPQFGALGGMDRGTVIEHIDDLIQRGCIAVGSLIFFPRLRLTDAGEQRLRTLVEVEIEQPEGMLVEPIAVPESGELFDEKSFWRQFYRDLRNARERVVIMSAFVSETRHSNDLFITFQGLLARKVKVTVYTRPLEEQDPEITEYGGAPMYKCKLWLAIE